LGLSLGEDSVGAAYAQRWGAEKPCHTHLLAKMTTSAEYAKIPSPNEGVLK
jgi:hypothetical protein